MPCLSVGLGVFRDAPRATTYCVEFVFCILLCCRHRGLLESKPSCRYAFVSLSLQSHESFCIRISSSHSFSYLVYTNVTLQLSLTNYSTLQFHRPAMSAPLPLLDPPAKPRTTLDASSTAPSVDNPLTEPWSVQSGTSLPLKRSPKSPPQSNTPQSSPLSPPHPLPTTQHPSPSSTSSRASKPPNAKAGGAWASSTANPSPTTCTACP